MIDARELRLGSWVEHNDEWCYRGEDVYQFQWDDSDWYALGESTMFIQNINPIPLTEQWLIDFGFGRRNDSNFWLNGFCLKIYDNEFYVLTEQKRVFIKFVHTLQNMYFCTEQKELKWSGLEKQNT